MERAAFVFLQRADAAAGAGQFFFEAAGPGGVRHGRDQPAAGLQQVVSGGERGQGFVARFTRQQHHQRPASGGVVDAFESGAFPAVGEWFDGLPADDPRVGCELRVRLRGEEECARRQGRRGIAAEGEQQGVEGGIHGSPLRRANANSHTTCPPIRCSWMIRSSTGGEHE